MWNPQNVGSKKFQGARVHQTKFQRATSKRFNCIQNTKCEMTTTAITPPSEKQSMEPGGAAHLLGCQKGGATRGLVLSARGMDDNKFLVQNTMIFILFMAICRALPWFALLPVLVVQGLGTKGPCKLEFVPDTSALSLLCLFWCPNLRSKVSQF